VPTGSALPTESIDDRLVLVGVVAEVAILFALILVPPLRAIFGLAPLGVTEWSPLVCFRAIVCWRGPPRPRRPGGVVLLPFVADGTQLHPTPSLPKDELPISGTGCGWVLRARAACARRRTSSCPTSVPRSKRHWPPGSRGKSVGKGGAAGGSACRRLTRGHPDTQRQQGIQSRRSGRDGARLGGRVRWIKMHAKSQAPPTRLRARPRINHPADDRARLLRHV